MSGFTPRLQVEGHLLQTEQISREYSGEAGVGGGEGGSQQSRESTKLGSGATPEAVC